MQHSIEHAEIECERCGSVLQTCRCFIHHVPQTVPGCRYCVHLSEREAVLVKHDY